MTDSILPAHSPTTLPAEIFKAYDIRGIVGKTLTPAIVESIGLAIGSLAHERGVTEIVVGRDGASPARRSSPHLPTACAPPAST